MFAECNVCKRKINLGKPNKALFLVRQHLLSQVHKTNATVAFSRSTGVSLELTDLFAQVEEKFPSKFIAKKASVVCKACQPEISLVSSRNVIGNLSQHLESVAHRRKSPKFPKDIKSIKSFFKKVPQSPNNKNV